MPRVKAKRSVKVLFIIRHPCQQVLVFFLYFCRKRHIRLFKLPAWPVPLIYLPHKRTHAVSRSIYTHKSFTNWKKITCIKINKYEILKFKLWEGKLPLNKDLWGHQVCGICPLGAAECTVFVPVHRNERRSPFTSFLLSVLAEIDVHKLQFCFPGIIWHRRDCRLNISEVKYTQAMDWSLS